MIKKHKPQGTVLVTGAAKRIGKAICLSLAASGYKIALHYNGSSREAKQLAETIRKASGTCELFRCDLSDEQQALQLIPDVRKKCGRIEALINNASVFEPSTIKNLNVPSLRQHFSVNFNAPYILTAQFAKHCKRGHIINILDTHVTDNTTRHSAYLLSKKALSELTRMSAIELAPHIRVNAVSPGLILPSTQTKSDQLNRLAKNVPLKRKGHPSHIAQSIEFLLNNASLTGQVIFNDGGEHLI